jgi:hypothetical protein
VTLRPEPWCLGGLWPRDGRLPWWRYPLPLAAAAPLCKAVRVPTLIPSVGEEVSARGGEEESARWIEVPQCSSE